MKVGVYLGTEHPAREPMAARVESLLAQTRMARDLGFDAVMAGQHFLSHPLQCLQPIPFLGRVAADAGDMAVGIGILLLPLHHPVEIAEQVATLDILCGGRFIFGVGLGYEDEEFAAFNIDRRHRLSRYQEALEIIKRLWTEEEVSFEGKHFQLDRVRPTHLPVQRPHPPVWVAANNHPAMHRAARAGDIWFSNPHAVYGTIAEQMTMYKAALEEFGKPMPEDVVACREVYVAETREKAFAVARPAIEQRYQHYMKEGQDEELPEGDRFDKPFEELARDRFVFGDPDDCVRELKRYEALGFTYLIMNYHNPLLSNDHAMRCLELFGREVLPQLR